MRHRSQCINANRDAHEALPVTRRGIIPSQTPIGPLARNLTTYGGGLVNHRIPLLLFVVLVALPSFAQDTSDFELPVIEYEKFILDNGLTVLVHEDHKASQ